jgi:hypothetical protein
VRVQYTNPGKPEGKRSPPKTMTRPIHKVAVVVPVEYVFEDDTCDNEVGLRGPKRDLKTKEEVEAAKASKKEPAKMKVGEPETGGAQPAVHKRRGRPKKSERPTTAEDEPQVEERNDASAAADAEAPLEAGGQPPAARRGRSRDLGPRGQRDRGRSC